MADPFTIGAIGAVALKEGVKFLYQQAGEAIRWRRRDKREGGEPSPPAPVSTPPEVFEERALTRAHLDVDALGRLEGDIRDLRAELADYAEDIEDVDPSDARLVSLVDALRRAMEALYGETLTFKGETRDAGVDVAGEARVQQVEGYVAGLRAQGILQGRVRGTVIAERVALGGQAVGVEAGVIGGVSTEPPGSADEDDTQRG